MTENSSISTYNYKKTYKVLFFLGHKHIFPLFEVSLFIVWYSPILSICIKFKNWIHFSNFDHELWPIVMWILFVTGISERKFSKIFTENFSLLFALNTVACVTNLLDAFLINLFKCCFILFNKWGKFDFLSVPNKTVCSISSSHLYWSVRSQLFGGFFGWYFPQFLNFSKHWASVFHMSPSDLRLLAHNICIPISLFCFYLSENNKLKIIVTNFSNISV